MLGILAVRCEPVGRTSELLMIYVGSRIERTRRGWFDKVAIKTWARDKLIISKVTGKIAELQDQK